MNARGGKGRQGGRRPDHGQAAIWEGSDESLIGQRVKKAWGRVGRLFGTAPEL